MNARFFLSPLGKMPTHFWINDLCMGETTAGELKFQAQVDAAYLSRGLPLQRYTKSISRVEDNVVESLVDFVYSDENVARLAWVPRKALNKQWSVLNHWAAMKSLVLKRDIASIYSLYAQRASAAHKVIGKSLFFTIVHHITGGCGKKQSARAGIDYIKVNFHLDNFEIVDKIIDIVVPVTDTDQEQRDEILRQKGLVFDFISYGYAHHVRKSVLTQYEFNDQRGKEHECNVTSEERCQFKAYKNSHTMSEFSDAFGIPEKQHEFVDSVKAQLDNCSTIQGCIADGYCTTSHSPYYTQDLAEDHAPKRTYSAAGRLECHACCAPFLFYDTLLQI